METRDNTGRIARIIFNARKLGKDSFHTAIALDIVAPVPGRTWSAICCFCLDKVEPSIDDDLVARISMTSARSAGACMQSQCSYSGCDTLIACLKTSEES